MSERLVIIGAGGHGKVIADLAQKCGCSNICFADDSAAGSCLGFPIVGTCQILGQLDDRNTVFVIAIGNNSVRRQIARQWNLPWATLVHPLRKSDAMSLWGLVRSLWQVL